MDQDSIEDLTAAAVRGDRAALELLLVRHLPDLRAYVRLRMGPALRDREGESDLIQSVCREVLLRADQFRHAGEGAFRAWLYTATLRKIVNRDEFHRAQRREAAREEVAQESGLLDVYRRFASPSGVATTAEELARIERAFLTLNDDYREVILLSRIVGLRREEVAREMDRSEASVRNLLHRALAQLAQELATEAP
ncbi:RNA polymerase sigma factor [Engelhardtia mirabilis]|uniref:ECF RNA polymerase sigma factor SigD n=1 Tax=Engelhardtia mirabilis TaxID=2528011 RepID=A0A518BR99_9BACT|nr:ECF RNA polymerase sigma factor SigD [Planctomycetes bacterium Pla133]QDV03833.1 ECF RNA polymerase sigma factor SigD [Planctomycetes bacterium Pla86]